MIDDGFGKFVGMTSVHRRVQLEELAKKKKLPISTLVSIALDHEFDREKPFTLETDPPNGEWVEGSHIEYASRLVQYLRKHSGMSLEMMMLCRHDAGILDKETFMLAFREALLSEMIEGYTPRQSRGSSTKYDEDFLFYRVKGSSTKAAKKLRREANKFEEYQKLKKEFGDE